MNTPAAGEIITFYSYKGGVGRSMALANVAWVLASNGSRVLMIDWDLEAPGLHRYFLPFLLDKDMGQSEGVIDFVIDFASAAASGVPIDEDSLRRHANILRYAASLQCDLPGGGLLDFVPAGRQGRSYSTRVNLFNWHSFYDRQGGGNLLEAARQRIRAEYDYVLIDSRTGVSDTSGICTVQMPDTLVLCFTLNRQSIDGVAAVAASVLAQRGGNLPRVLPVPMRIERAEARKLEEALTYARRALAPFLLTSAPDSESYWNAVQFPYVPYYAYTELLATFGDRPGQSTSLLSAVERLTEWITNGRVKRMAPQEEQYRRAIVTEFENIG